MWKSKIQSVPSLFIVVNSISWFLLTLVLIVNILYPTGNEGSSQIQSEYLISISAAYFGGLIISSIIGGTLLSKALSKKKYLLLWNFSGVFSCLLFFIFYSETNLITTIILSLILSSSAGLGIPSSLSLFSKQSKSEKRGRLGAIVFFAIQIFAALIIMQLDPKVTGIHFLVLAIWRLLGVVGLVFYKPIENKIMERPTSIFSIIRERRFLLFFFPWFMFTLINFIETPLLHSTMTSNFYNFYVLITNIISSVVAIVAGFLCDLKGRKITGITGFIFLGIGYAFLSLFFSSYRDFSYFSFMFFDGAAWGFLYVAFIFVIWGDLAEGNNQNREKYYVLGGLPFLLSGLIQVVVPLFAGDIIGESGLSTSFSLASFFLFLAIVPLLYAPETLAEKIMKDRELNSYVQKALGTVNKKKETKKQSKKEETENSSHEEEAKKLAEKYY